MEETVICRLCLEPIYNFICVNCLGKSVSRWLSKMSSSLLSGFQKFHNFLLNNFSSDQNHEFCIKCKNTIDTVICPYCYVKEIFWWVFDEDTTLAKKFAKQFNYDFMGLGYLPNLKTRNLMPPAIVVKGERSDIGICESCGQVSYDLKEKNGSWLCESCVDL